MNFFFEIFFNKHLEGEHTSFDIKLKKFHKYLFVLQNNHLKQRKMETSSMFFSEL
jgi:hypothetical protein